LSNILRVGNIGFVMESTRLKEIFAEFGTVVDATVMESPFSGKSRGFGFIEMSSEAEAAACLTNLNGKELDGGIKLDISEAAVGVKKKRVRRKIT
jgi:cold-inducible RNA-binding protein